MEQFLIGKLFKMNELRTFDCKFEQACSKLNSPSCNSNLYVIEFATKHIK